MGGRLMSTKTTRIIDADAMLDRYRKVKPLIISEGPGCSEVVARYIAGKRPIERARLELLMLALER
jgi:hypothetical protein